MLLTDGITSAQRAERKRRQQEFMTEFIGGKQKRARRLPTIEGLPEAEFIRRNADPAWLVQNELWKTSTRPNVHRKMIMTTPA